MAFDGGLPHRDRRPVAPKRGTKGDDKRQAAIAAALMKDHRKAQAALAETQFTKFEAAVVEWLMSAVNDQQPDRNGRLLGYSFIRERFAHRISKASPETMGKVRAFVGLLVEAIEVNDGPALAQLVGFFDEFVGIHDQSHRIRRALVLVEHAAAALGRDPNARGSLGAPIWLELKFYLNPLDRRFRKLTEAEIRTALGGVNLARNQGSKIKGGRSLPGPRSALAKLASTVGAFDARDADQMAEKIKTAFSKKAAGSRAQSVGESSPRVRRSRPR